ncbi:hypothetical protein [Allocatelliglobosispora scoriae]|nr:hypothetical protein [Allocatelliglobosispora scoriae]
MVRRMLLVGGAALALIGFVLGLSSIALPWLDIDVVARVDLIGFSRQQHDSKPVFALDGGAWFFVVLMLLFLLVLAATLTSGAVSRLLGGAGMALSVAGLAVVVAIWPDTDAGDSSVVSALGFAQAQTELTVGVGAVLAPIALLILGAAALLIGLGGGIGDWLRRVVAAAAA